MQAAIAFTLSRPDFPDMLPVAHRIAALRENSKQPGESPSTTQVPMWSVPQSPSTVRISRSLDLCRPSRAEESALAHKLEVGRPLDANFACISGGATGKVLRTESQHAQVDAFTLSSWIGTAHVSSPGPKSSSADSGHVSSDVANHGSGQDVASAFTGLSLDGEAGVVMSGRGPVCGEIQHRPQQGKSGEGFSAWCRPKLAASSEAAAVAAKEFLGSKYAAPWRGGVEALLEARASSSGSVVDLPSLGVSPSSTPRSSLSRDSSANARPPCGETSNGIRKPISVPQSPFSFASAVPKFASGSSGTAQDATDVSSMDKVRSTSLSQWLEPQVSGRSSLRGDFSKCDTAPPIGDTTELEGPKLKNFLSVGNTQANHPPVGVPSSFRHNLLGGWRPSGSLGLRQSSSPGQPEPRSVRATTLTPPRSLPVAERPSAYAVGQVPLKKRSASSDFY